MFVLLTDTSGTGWGGLVHRLLNGAPTGDVLATQGRFPAGHPRDSVVTEAAGLLAALLEFGSVFQGQVLRWRTDNMSSFYLVRNGGGRSNLLNLIARKIFMVCAALDIDLQAEHISGTAIIRSGADALSRDLERDDQALTPTVLATLTGIVGPFSVDLFTCERTTLVQDGLPLPFYSRFVSSAEHCLGLDALAHAWPDRAYGFPPPSIALPTVLRALASPLAVTLILPRWPSQPWWPLLVGNQRVTVIDLGPAAAITQEGPSGNVQLVKDAQSWASLRLIAAHVHATLVCVP